VSRRRSRPVARTGAQKQRLGVAVLLVASILLYWAYLHHLPFAGGPDGAIVRAEVRTAANVNSRTPVRVGGTDVGTVEKLKSAGGGRTTTIVMRITEPSVSVRSDARADVRYRTLLGGSMYVSLDPGSASAPPLGDRTIPLARTNAQVDWDEFNSVWAKPVPHAQQQLVKGFADALEDPAALRKLLHEGGPALDSFGKAARAGRGEHDGELISLIRNAAGATRGLASDGTSLDELIRGAQRTAGATAGARVALGETIDALPGALHSARTTMVRLDGTLTRLDPLADELVPAARATAPALRRLRPAVRSLDRLLRHAGPLLKTAPPALRALRGTARAGIPFLAALEAMSTRLVTDVLPWLSTVDPKTRLKIYEEIGPWLSGQNDSYSDFDDNGYFLRGAAHQSPDSAVLPCSGDVQRCVILRRVFRKVTGGER
jgi:ABC-type transporter Mla subunit MlaD